MSQKLLIFVTYSFLHPLATNYYETLKIIFRKINSSIDIAFASISPCYGNFIL